MKAYFDHEKLDVYQETIAFCGWVGELLGQISAKAAAKDQLDRASTSIPLNIAEGNGRHTAPDRCHFFDVARGSALECAAALDVAEAKGVLNKTEMESGKAELAEIVFAVPLA